MVGDADTPARPAHEWRVLGRSVRGAQHERAGRPNQDAILWLPPDGAGPPLVLAASDGHGGARYFRSETGARLGVETAARTIRDFLDGQAEGQDLSVVKRAAEEWLPKALVRRWREAVAEHLALNPLSAEERDLLDATGAARPDAPTDLTFIYGATLLTTVVSDAFILHLQLGDGHVLSVSERGEVSQPLPGDERLFANETTSLCAPGAWRDFRSCFQALSGAPPALILLSTDGYPNSFRDEAAFLQVGPDLWAMIRDGGLGGVEENLESWLAEATRAGSGDDVTLGLICRLSAVSRPADGEAGGAVESVPGSVSAEGPLGA